MLVTINPNRTLWEALLPAECLEMSAELVMVDRLLDDPRGGRLVVVAAVLPGAGGRAGAAPDHPDEDHQALQRVTVEALNEALLAKAHGARVIKIDKVRATPR